MTSSLTVSMTLTGPVVNLLASLEALQRFPYTHGLEGEVRISGNLDLDEHFSTNTPDLNMLIEDFLDDSGTNLTSQRALNCLKRARIDTLGELLLKSGDNLLDITNFGEKSLDHVKDRLQRLGLSLRG